MDPMHRGTLLTLGLILGSGPTLARGEAPLPAGVRVVAGEESALVRRNRSMPWRKLGASPVPEGVELSCEQTCRVKVDAESMLVLAPGAVVSMGSFFHVPLVSRDVLVPARQVELREGRIDASSTSARAMPLVVSALGSSHVALRAAGAQISLGNGHLAVRVTAGTARVGASRKWISVENGQSTLLPEQGGPSSPVPGLPAPQWALGPECSSGLAVGLGGGPFELGGCWKPIDGAVSYVVELSRSADFSTLEVAEQTTKVSWSKAVSEGRYFLRVRATDAESLASPDSSPRRLGVIAIKLPPGSIVDAEARTVTIPQGHSVELADPTDLESAFDAARFQTAERFVVVDNAATHVVRLRFKDDPGSIGSVVLQRRALSAEVTFSPKLARWPQDPIDITVTLTDASRVVDPSQISPKMHVLVGLAEVPLAWSQNGRVWTARLAPRNVAPTVLRVIAEDEFGTTIGRNFVEIDQARTSSAEGPGSRYVAHNHD